MASGGSNFAAILILSLTFFLVNNPLKCGAGNVLYSVVAVYPETFLQYNETKLTLQENCTLVLSKGSTVIWQKHASDDLCNLTLETNGELVLYDVESGKPLWSSNKTGLVDHYVLVLDSTHIAVYGPHTWATGTTVKDLSPTDGDMRAKNVLFPGQVVKSGDSLRNDEWVLRMQSDCDLVLYEEGSHQIWATNTSGKGDACYAKMELTGDLVIYDGSHNQIWSSNTASGSRHSVLVLQNDRNLVIYGPVLWESPIISISSEADTPSLLQQ